MPRGACGAARIVVRCEAESTSGSPVEGGGRAVVVGGGGGAALALSPDRPAAVPTEVASEGGREARRWR